MLFPPARLFKLKVYDCVLGLLLSAGVCSFYQKFQATQEEHLIAAIKSDVEEYSNLQDPYILNRSVGRLESFRLLHCVQLVSKTRANRETALIDRSGEPECRSYMALLSHKIDVHFSSSDGSRFWRLSFIVSSGEGAATAAFLIFTIWCGVFLVRAFQNLRDEQVIASYREQMLAAESRRHLAQQVAHDIRSPLSLLNILIGRMGSSKEAELISSAAQRINSIANDLLKNTQQMDDDSNAITRVEVSSVIKQVVKEKSVEFPKASIKYANCDHDVWITANRIELVRILSNLINNAIDASEAAPQMAVVVDVVEGSDYSEIKVTDSGKGMSERDLKRLGNYRFTTKKKGNGLGIYYAKTQIREWGGRLKANSEVGVGTCVTLSLPNAK